MRSVLFLALLVVVAASDLCVGSVLKKYPLKVGKALNIFEKHGYLEEFLRVIPFDDEFYGQKWLLTMPTRTIYKNLSDLIEIRKANNPKNVLGDFRVKLCDDRLHLYREYFQDFKIEHGDRPWEVFTGGWDSDDAAKKLGINSSFIQGDYSYILVRIARYRQMSKLKSQIPPNQPLQDEVIEGKSQMAVGNVSATVKFLESFGTHYINSYTTGNSLYQVFVYNRTTYQVIKDSIKSKGFRGISDSDYKNFFSPWYAEHLGKIRSASANETVERWAQRKLQRQYSFFSFQSLLVADANETLKLQLDNLLGNEAVLKLDLQSLTIIFRDDANKQKWFDETLSNQMRLWEENGQLNFDCGFYTRIRCGRIVLGSPRKNDLLP